uniref:Complex 1 LYR protein domain-containing protein n=1 Tax=Knipowitschia caucasica TaxID=637954 RepID=A0AAV2L5R9_KNICA
MLLRESSKFPSYNYRTYAVRRVRDAFRDNRSVQEPELLNRLLQEGEQRLQMIRRQVLVGQLYATQKSIIE